MIALLKRLWCNLTHGGGWIMRDPLGHINWQCAQCGRWSVPVPLDEEARHFEVSMRNAVVAEREACASVCEALEPREHMPGEWLTVVYRDVQPGDEARELIGHPKMSAASWSHALNDRDAAMLAAPPARKPLPSKWSVINSGGAVVCEGVDWETAWDYMTDDRIARGWVAVCVVDKDNVPHGITGGA